jgi:hypothetical protein
MANDILLIVLAVGLMGLAGAFLLVFVIALVFYFRKNQFVSDLDVLKKKWLSIARLQYAGQYGTLWISGIPYASKLQETVSSLNEVFKAMLPVTDGGIPVPSVPAVNVQPQYVSKLNDTATKLDELNGRIRTNMKGIPLGRIIGYTIIDIQSDIDFAYQKVKTGDGGTYVLRTPNGKTIVLKENEIDETRRQIRSWGSHLHLFVFEKQYGFTIPFLYSNKSTQLLIAYDDQVDIFGTDVSLRGAGINSFAGILYLTGYANREIPEVTSIIHASYANLVENVVGAGSEITNKAIGMDATSTKMLAANIAAHPTPSKPEK